MNKYVVAERRAQAAATERFEFAKKLYGSNPLLSSDDVAELAREESARVYDDVFDRFAA